MKATDFPADVLAPRPYLADGDEIKSAALYRGWFERLVALGFIDKTVALGAQPYVAIMRALNELERLRSLTSVANHGIKASSPVADSPTKDNHD